MLRKSAPPKLASLICASVILPSLKVVSLKFTFTIVAPSNIADLSFGFCHLEVFSIIAPLKISAF
ncbi:MAG UNVERIFIED_CONTAM: hypothetical protein LVQ98_05860 [Rickettsiaceae bacterium]|jgi:hypothetical protein